MSGRAIVVLMLALASSGCMFKKKAAPPPAPPAAITTPVAVTPPPTILKEPVPELKPATVPTSAPPVGQQTPLPPPPKPPRRPPRRQRNPQPQPATQAPAVTPAPVPPPAPQPHLGEILTPAQQAEMNRTVVQSVGAARAALARLRGRNLSAEQAEAAARIRTFAEQADQARKTDLRSAVQLARRAEVLARDLEGSIRY